MHHRSPSFIRTHSITSSTANSPCYIISAATTATPYYLLTQVESFDCFRQSHSPEWKICRTKNADFECQKAVHVFTESLSWACEMPVWDAHNRTSSNGCCGKLQVLYRYLRYLRTLLSRTHFTFPLKNVKWVRRRISSSHSFYMGFHTRTHFTWRFHTRPHFTFEIEIRDDEKVASTSMAWLQR